MTERFWKYYIGKATKLCLLCLLLSFAFFAKAQENVRTDTMVKLRYQVDTAVAEDTVTAIEEEESDIISNEDTKDQQEYFLRKEFTGGFGDSLELPRQIPDTALNELRKDKAFWYANEVFKKKQAKQEQSFTAQPLFQTILWIIIITGFVVFLFMYLANSNISLFRRSSVVNVNEEEIEETDIFSIEYQKEIGAAINSGDYRLAVRLLFLQLLRNLSDRNIIQYKSDSTNMDYLLQLRTTNLYSGFAWLARNYEYSWYGHFDIDKEKFDLIKKEFEKFDYKNLAIA